MQALGGGGSSQRVKELERKVESLERQLERALAQVERLRRQLEEALPASQRAAAPFSKGTPQPDPKPPGRKPGAACGKPATRPIPSRVDEQIRVVLREHCPHCQGSVILRGAKPQYQEDILRADGAVAPAHRAGAGTGLWAEVEP